MSLNINSLFIITYFGVNSIIPDSTVVFKVPAFYFLL